MTKRKSSRCERRCLQALGSEHSVLTAAHLAWQAALHLLLQPSAPPRCPEDISPRTPPFLIPLNDTAGLQMTSSRLSHHQVLTVPLESVEGPQHLSSGFSQLPPLCLHPALTLAFMKPDMDHICSCSKTFHSSLVPSEVPEPWSAIPGFLLWPQVPFPLCSHLGFQRPSMMHIWPYTMSLASLLLL